MSESSDKGASPYCAPYLSRRQAEELLRLVAAQPQKKWLAVAKNLANGLNANSPWTDYHPDGTTTTRTERRDSPMEAAEKQLRALGRPK